MEELQTPLVLTGLPSHCIPFHVCPNPTFHLAPAPGRMRPLQISYLMYCMYLAIPVKYPASLTMHVLRFIQKKPLTKSDPRRMESIGWQNLCR